MRTSDRRIVVVLVIMGVIGVGLTLGNHMMKDKTKTVLQVGIPATWGDLNPALQHTANADTIIKNVFESLVRSGQGGKVEPLAAKSWVVSNDYKVFTFKIDRSRKFSDGTPLLANHFKKAWEHALTLQPKSANSSLQDLLYKVEGFENFESSNMLGGLVVRDDDTFEVRFKSPFRMALDRLCGGRFGAFLIRDEKWLGTGDYSIENYDDNRVQLRRNAFSSEHVPFEQVSIIVVSPNDARKSLQEGSIDVLVNGSVAGLEECASEAKNISCLTGDEVAHSNLEINGLSGRFFSNKEYRLALQALILSALPHLKKPRRFEVNNFRWDPQVFLPMQAGRLDDEEVKELIDKGLPFVEKLVSATQSHALFYVSRYEQDWILDFLRSKGIKFNENSGVRDIKTLMHMIYKTYEPDLMLLSASVASGDPDGVYHFLGPNGAILSPMSYREKPGKLLEQGRAIIDSNQLDAHYKKSVTGDL